MFRLKGKSRRSISLVFLPDMCTQSFAAYLCMTNRTGVCLGSCRVFDGGQSQHVLNGLGCSRTRCSGRLGVSVHYRIMPILQRTLGHMLVKPLFSEESSVASLICMQLTRCSGCASRLRLINFHWFRLICVAYLGSSRIGWLNLCHVICIQ